VTVAAVRYIRTRLDAQLLEARSNVYAFTWLPPSGTTQVRLP
jgi:phage-related protein